MRSREPDLGLTVRHFYPARRYGLCCPPDVCRVTLRYLQHYPSTLQPEHGGMTLVSFIS
jgi:hypothetical protein